MPLPVKIQSEGPTLKIDRRLLFYSVGDVKMGEEHFMWHIIYVLVCVLVGYLGRDTQIGFWGFFFLSILFTPLIGVFILAVSAPRRLREKGMNKETSF